MLFVKLLCCLGVVEISVPAVGNSFTLKFSPGNNFPSFKTKIFFKDEMSPSGGIPSMKKKSRLSIIKINFYFANILDNFSKGI